jgi:hypothetical protein
MKKRKLLNPLAVFGAKQKPDPEAVDKIAMVALVSLDAAKRGAAPAGLADTLTLHVMTGVLLYARMGNRAMYDMGVEAWNALVKACQRDTKLLDLTTGEYQKIRRSMQYYLRALPSVEVGILAAATIEARERLNFMADQG